MTMWTMFISTIIMPDVEERHLFSIQNICFFPVEAAVIDFERPSQVKPGRLAWHDGPKAMQTIVLM